MIKNQQNRKIDIWLSVILVSVVVLLSGVTYITGDLSTYMATPLAIANEGIFSNDFSIMEFTRPNAQSISDNFVALFLRLGISWQTLSLVLYILTAIIFGAGIIAMSKRFAGVKYYIIAGVMIFFSIYALSGLRIGRNPIWYPSFYYAQLAFGIAVWGFVKAWDKKWYQAFILFAIATLFHFTAGSYCAAFALVFLIIEAFKTKNFKLLTSPLIWILSCVGIFLMMYLSGTTGSGLLSSDAFVKIHAYLRHPHHHVPSSWEKLEWKNYFCYISAVFIIFRYSSKHTELYVKLRNFLLITTAMMAGILLINYIFIEIIPVAFIAKLQPARNVFVYRFFLAAILALSVYNLIIKKEYYGAALVVVLTTLPQIDTKTYSGILLLLAAVYFIVLNFANRKDIVSIKVFAHLASAMLVILTVALFAGNIPVLIIMMYSIAFIALMASAVLTDELGQKKEDKILTKVILAVLSVAIILIPWVDITGNFSGITFKSANSVMTLFDVDFSAKVLAERFGENTDEDVIFLGDPNDIATSYFRIFSLRATVVAYKNMPFTDEGMLEWVTRLTDLKAVSKDEQGFYVRNTSCFGELSAQELLDIAGKYKAEYILVKFGEEKLSELYDLGAKAFDSQGSWTVIETP